MLDFQYTDDEIKIITMRKKGKSVIEICNALNISESTYHRKRREIERMMRMENVRISEKMNLTIKEAAEYSNIGRDKIIELCNSNDCTFVLKVGRKTLIKRKEFEKYISAQYVL